LFIENHIEVDLKKKGSKIMGLIGYGRSRNTSQIPRTCSRILNRRGKLQLLENFYPICGSNNI
jgi:hypothetical protein